MKNQILTLMIGAAVLVTSPVFAMDDDARVDEIAPTHKVRNISGDERNQLVTRLQELKEAQKQEQELHPSLIKKHGLDDTQSGRMGYVLRIITERVPGVHDDVIASERRLSFFVNEIKSIENLLDNTEPLE